jgi:hypothetical protein
MLYVGLGKQLRLDYRSRQVEKAIFSKTDLLLIFKTWMCFQIFECLWRHTSQTPKLQLCIVDNLSC